MFVLKSSLLFVFDFSLIIGISPTNGDQVKVQLTTFSTSGKPVGRYVGTETLFEIGGAQGFCVI